MAKYILCMAGTVASYTRFLFLASMLDCKANGCLWCLLVLYILGIIEHKGFDKLE